MTTADEKMRDKWKLVDSDCRDGDNGIITYHVVAFDEGWQASAAQYSERIKELEQQLRTEEKFRESTITKPCVGHDYWQRYYKAECDALKQQNEQLQAQVSMLRESLYSSMTIRVQNGSTVTYPSSDEAYKALSATIQTAEAYKRRIQAEARAEYRKELLSKMVDRFLSWKLPKNFSPDAGISFTPEYNKEYMASIGKPPMRHEPMGTNLFDADQAKSMVAVMLGGISDEQVDDAVDNLKASFNSELCNQAKQAEIKDGE